MKVDLIGAFFADIFRVYLMFVRSYNVVIALESLGETKKSFNEK